MGTELDIEIEVQQMRKEELQEMIYGPFLNNTFPEDQKYRHIAEAAQELLMVEHTLGVLEELRDSIISNSRDAPTPPTEEPQK